jgi:hypothetical protein
MTLGQIQIITLAISALLVSVRAAGGQQVQQIEAGIQPPKADQTDHKLPSGFVLVAKSAGWSALGSVVGGAAGLAVDQAYCERHHGKERSFLFGPCTFYANEGFGTGWFGGAVLGATFGTARVAEKRGCARKAAIFRAAVGSAFGAIPGVAIVAQRTGKYPPSRSIFIAGAPFLSGIGAAVAVRGCHAP